jgi:hypothetical protein
MLYDGHMSNFNLTSLHVRTIRPDEEPIWDELMQTHHYLGFERLVGESIKYVAVLGDQWAALIGWGTAAFKCVSRDRWIGWSPEQQWERLRFIANNQRFLILPDARQPNLASKTLALNLRRLSADWEAVFGHPIVLVETFVDQARFRGTCYLAANWLPLGQTKGFSRNGGRYYYHGNPKTILVRELAPNARLLLSAPFLSPILQRKGETILDLNTVNVDGSDSLITRLEALPDPRFRRGIRHSWTSIYAVAICAVLCGARNFVAIAQWAAKQNQDTLRRLGCRYDVSKDRYIPPSEPTIRRALQSSDANLLDRIINDWLASQTQGRVVAVDGKTLRGSGSADRKPLHLMAALLHKEGVVVSQCEVDSKTNEICAFKPLLDPLDLEGVIVTADAMHAQTEHARYLVEEKKANYVFTVKGNQPTLFDNISTLEEEDFSPSIHCAKQGSRAH